MKRRKKICSQRDFEPMTFRSAVHDSTTWANVIIILQKINRWRFDDSVASLVGSQSALHDVIDDVINDFFLITRITSAAQQVSEKFLQLKFSWNESSEQNLIFSFLVLP